MKGLGILCQIQLKPKQNEFRKIPLLSSFTSCCFHFFYFNIRYCLMYNSNLTRLELKKLWDQRSQRCPCLVLILSIRRCGINWNPLITQILPISHTFCPILSHYLFRFLRTRSFNYASIPLIFSTFRPGFLYYSFHLFALFIPNHSLWTGRNHPYLRGFSR